MTKKEFAEGWKHFCSYIKWDRTFLDAKAIQFMNEGIGEVAQTFQQRDDLLALCKEFMEKADNGAADFDDPEPGSIFLRAKAAIASVRS